MSINLFPRFNQTALSYTAGLLYTTRMPVYTLLSPSYNSSSIPTSILILMSIATAHLRLPMLWSSQNIINSKLNSNELSASHSDRFTFSGALSSRLAEPGNYVC